MRRHSYALCFALIPSASFSASLSDAVHLAWQQAPLISTPLQEQARLADAYHSARSLRLIPNEPVFTYGNTDDNTGQSYGITEVFGFPGKAFAYLRFEDAKRLMQEAENKARRYELTRTIIQTYIDSAVTVAALELARKNLADLETLNASMRARYESGVATQAEAIGTQLQLNQLRADLREAEDKVKTSAKRYERLMGKPPDHLELPDDIDPQLIRDLGPSTADELRAAAAARIAQASHSVVWWSELPDVLLGAQRNYYPYQPGSPSGKRFSTSFSLGITLPFLFPWIERVDAVRQTHQTALDLSAAQIQAVNATSDREDAALEYARSKTRLAEIRSHDLPLADALFESTFSAYRSGKLGFAELILARKTLTDLRSQDIQLRSSIINAHLRSFAEVPHASL